MTREILRTTVATLALIGLSACGGGEKTDAAAENKTDPRVMEAKAFLDDADAQIAAMAKKGSPIFWAYATNINDDTAKARAQAGAEWTQLGVSLANASKQFNDVDLPADLARKMGRLKSGTTIPAPSTDGAAADGSCIDLRGRTLQAGSKYR